MDPSELPTFADSNPSGEQKISSTETLDKVNWEALITKNAQHIQNVDHNHPNYRELAKQAIKKAPSALKYVKGKLKLDINFLIEIYQDQKGTWKEPQVRTFKNNIPTNIQAAFEAQIRAQVIA